MPKHVCIAMSGGVDSSVVAALLLDAGHAVTGATMVLHEENMRAFEYILSGVEKGRSPAVWAAWGNIIEKRSYLPRCVEDMIALGERYGAQWFTAGKRSVKGHPHHPLYLRKDEKLRPFDTESYLRSFDYGK